MHHFIYATKDTWISSGSNNDTGESFKDQNFGRDQILELKKEFFNSSFNYPTRVLVDFSGTEFNEMSKSIVDGTIPRPQTGSLPGSKFFLRLYEAEGNQEQSIEYTLHAQPISQSWDEGVGKFGDNPKTTNGCSWENRFALPGATELTWSNSDGTRAYGVTTLPNSISSSTQTFSNESPDVNIDITDMTEMWLNGQAGNYGVMLRFTGSQETDATTFGQLKFFSAQTHTIFAPRIEIKWDDHKPCTGSNTGSLTELTMSGAVDNFLYMIGLRESYKMNERVKFRVAGRKEFIQKTFSTSVQTISRSFIPEGSGSYSIQDIGTGETVVPFSAFTSMSCDSTSNYFIQYLNGFYPDRVYKIIYKLKQNDGQEIIHDNDFEFIVRR